MSLFNKRILAVLLLLALVPAGAYAASEPDLDPEKLYRILLRKVNIARAEVPTFNSSQKLEHKGKFCDLTLTWQNVSCTDTYNFHLKDFDSKNVGTRMSNIYPRIILIVSDKTKRVKHTKTCLDGTSKEEMLNKMKLDLKRPGGLDVYKSAAAAIYLIRHCGGK